MPELKIQIKNILHASLFLDSKRQEALLAVLDKASEEEQQELLHLLETEKDFLRKLFKKLVKKGDKESMAHLERVLLKTKGKMRGEVEKNTHENEMQNVEDLLADM